MVDEEISDWVDNTSEISDHVPRTPMDELDEIERRLDLEFKRKSLEDADIQRNTIRKMAWFSLAGLLVYPFGIFLTSLFGLDQAATLIAEIAGTYFASIAVLVSAFFAADAVGGKKKD